VAACWVVSGQADSAMQRPTQAMLNQAKQGLTLSQKTLASGARTSGRDREIPGVGGWHDSSIRPYLPYTRSSIDPPASDLEILPYFPGSEDSAFSRPITSTVITRSKFALCRRGNPLRLKIMPRQ